MSSSSLVKFAGQTQRRGQKLWWGRAGEDGAPYRGPAAPYLTSDEFEARTVRVSDFQFRFFDVTLEADAEAYREVMDAVANGWFQLRLQQHFWNGTTKHYVEWLEFYLQDGSRTPFLSDGVLEVNPGANGNGTGHPG